MKPPSKIASALRASVGAIVDFAGDRPWLVVLGTIAALALTWGIASRLELRTDLLQLLPRDSAGLRAFERQSARVGGGAALIVIAEGDDRVANERFIDALSDRVRADAAAATKCRAACKDAACLSACPPELVRYVEGDTRDVHAYFAKNKWLYASLDELERADEQLDLRIAERSGLVEDLETVAAAQPASARDAPAATKDEGAPAGDRDLEAREKELDARLAKIDGFPTGWFETPDGRMVAMRVISRVSGMGDSGGKLLHASVMRAVAELDPAKFGKITVGYAGDIPNAIAEQESLASEAVVATLLVLALILGGVVAYFRSLASLLVIGVPAVLGVGVGYAFAALAFGYVNTVGAFLGAIILGNGINYPIVLFARYRDFRAHGMDARTARREAVLNALRAELVGACVASIAYGSLTVTRFRGFSQFGTIGFVGMLAVWAAIVPVVPALIVLTERRAPAVIRGLAREGDRATRALAWLTERGAGVIVALALVAAGVAASRLPGWIADPWEYDFSRLGSKGSQQRGPGIWSVKASEVFGGKMNVAGALMLADSPEQVPAVKAKILANDAADPEGTLVAEVATVADLLPGTAAEQAKKLAVLARIRGRLTPRVLARMPADERPRLQRLVPPAGLAPLGANDLPPLLRHRFEENDGRVGTVFYVKYRNEVSFSDGRTLLRMARTTDDIQLPDGKHVVTASRATIFAEIIRSMERDGPLATGLSFAMVVLVVVFATGTLAGALSVCGALVLGVLWMTGAMAHLDVKLNFLNFVALPVTFGIGCEYPFNVFDRARLLGGDARRAVVRSAGPVALCSYTTVVGYLSMLYADNQALQSFGKVAASGEIACAVSALVVLPAVLHLLNRRGAGLLRWGAPSAAEGSTGGGE